MDDIYKKWLTIKLENIKRNLNLGATISQAVNLSGCSGQLSQNLVIKKSKDVYNVVKKYNLDPYTASLSTYFSTLIFYGKHLYPNIFNEISNMNKKSLTLKTVIAFYTTVQSLMYKHYVFYFCTTNDNQQLFHSPPNVWPANTNFDDVTKDSIYTLWFFGQKDEKLRYKLSNIPFLPPYIGYDENSFKGEFRVFYPEKDDIYISREKILKL